MSISLMNLKDDQTKAMNADTSLTFDRTTDSLEAQRDHFDDIVGTPAGTDIAADIAAVKSVADTIHGVVDAIGTVTDLNQELDQRTVAKTATVKTVNSNATVDIVNITDKGVLTGVASNIEYGTGGIGTVTIIVDGVTIADAARIVSSGAAATHSTGSLSFVHRFDTSLRVQHNVASGNATQTTTVSYTTD